MRNTGTAPTSAWTVTFAFTGGQQVSQVWSAALTQSGAAVTARNVTYNGTLAPSGSTTFGFLASGAATGPSPAVACTAS